MKNIARIVFLILFYMGLTSINTNAQTAQLQNGFSFNKPVPESTFDANPDDSIQSHFAIKINPLQWLWDDIRLLVEVPINKNNSLQFRIGYRNSAINPYDLNYHAIEASYWNDSTMQIDTGRYSCTGFSLGIGFNHFFAPNWYWQPSFLFKKYSFTFSHIYAWHYSLQDYLAGIYDELDFRDDFTKSVYCIEFRVGKFVRIRGICFDIYGGIGARYKTRLVSKNNERGSNIDSSPSGIMQNVFTGSLNGGVNVCFIQNKKK